MDLQSHRFSDDPMERTTVKKPTIFLIFILAFSMIIPMLQIMPNSESDSVTIDVSERTIAPAATPASDAHVIRVTEDVIVVDQSPDANYVDYVGNNGLPIGLDGIGATGRIWLKFNLTHIPRNTHFTRATVNLFCASGINEDEPLGIYYSENDTWDDATITWNNAPSYDSVPIDVIDSPSTPDMFVTGNWYGWDVTTEVQQVLGGDGTLSFLLKLVDESSVINSFKSFYSKEVSISDGKNTIPNIALEYNAPQTSGLQVDGFSTSPQIDYIKNANPDLGWTSSDADSNDFQTNYEVEVWNSSSYDETLLGEENNTRIEVIHDTAGAGTSPSSIFDNIESRYQYLWPESMISQSGVVDKLYFEVDKLTGQTTYSDLAIYMTCVESNLTNTFEDNYNGTTPIQVLNRTSYTANIEDGYLIFDVENIFTLQSNLKLLIELRHTGSSGTAIDGVITDSGGWLCAVEYPGYYAWPIGTVTDIVTQGLKLELTTTEVLSDGSSSNAIPFNHAPGFSLRVQQKYNQSLISDVGIIDRLLFPTTGFGDVTFSNFRVYLVETPVKGALSHTDMDSNYGGQTPILVLDQPEYIVRDYGRMLVIDVNDTFSYSGTNDLLIELSFSNTISGAQSVISESDRGVYRAWDTYIDGNDTVGPDLYIDFIHDTTSITYSGTPLVNGTRYYWRVRTCDSMGLWSLWENGSFKYEILTSLPSWSNFLASPQPLEFGGFVTVSLDVTHTSGISSVEIEYDGINHTMSNVGDTYSHTWIPSSTATIPYTIFMQSQSGTWNNISDSIVVVDTTAPEWVSTPTDKVLYYGEALSIQLNATDLSGIANWAINDDVYFDITNGLLTNKTTLELGGYFLNVTVTDNEGNSLSGTFIVAVLESMTTTISTTTTTTTTTSGTTTSTTTTDTTTTSPTSPTYFGQLDLIHIGLIGVIVILVFVIILQKRKK